jgi:hypothetical protein
MTMAAPQGNDATLTAAAGGQRLQGQWWRQKRWDNNDRDDRQQRLQAVAVTMAGVDNNQQEAAAGVAKTVLWRQWEQSGGGCGGGCR